MGGERQRRKMTFPTCCCTRSEPSWVGWVCVCLWRGAVGAEGVANPVKSSRLAHLRKATEEDPLQLPTFGTYKGGRRTAPSHS